jgi:hypothetical protein
MLPLTTEHQFEELLTRPPAIPASTFQREESMPLFGAQHVACTAVLLRIWRSTWRKCKIVIIQLNSLKKLVNCNHNKIIYAHITWAGIA